jgi:hypothetical protein
MTICALAMEVRGVASTDNQGPDWHHTFVFLISHLARADSTISHPAATPMDPSRPATFAYAPDFHWISKP